MNARILRAGPLTSVQDLGRDGHRELGVGSAGALDSFGARVANILAGNDEGAAVIEITLGNCRIGFQDERVAAWTGGSFEVSVAGEAVPRGHMFRIGEGDELHFAMPQLGCRAWLAISGGVDVPAVLGSCSTDLRAGFGGFKGRALQDGDDVPLGRTTDAAQARVTSLRDARSADWGAPAEWVGPAQRYPILRVIRGPDWARFDRSAHDALLGEVFSATVESDRMGIRLDGCELPLLANGDLLSEAVAPGTIQVPPNGQPILLLGDCQTIGGYPKIAHVITVDLPIAAQLRAGDEVRFRETSIAEAHALLAQRENDLALFRVGVSLKT